MIFLKTVFALSFSIVALALSVPSTLCLHQRHLRSFINYLSTQTPSLLETSMTADVPPSALQNSTLEIKHSLMVMLSGLSNPTVIVGSKYWL
jgi:hypothetical protein